MRVKVSTTISPELPEHRTVDADSTLEAVRRVLGSKECDAIFERCKRKGGGSIVISAFPARENTDATQRVPTPSGGLKLS